MRIALDTNVLVGLLDDNDAQNTVAAELFETRLAKRDQFMFFEFVLEETVSVLGRRLSDGDLDRTMFDEAISEIRSWYDAGLVHPLAEEDREEIFFAASAVVAETTGRLSVVDALLVVAQRRRSCDAVATFDRGFDLVPDVLRISSA